MKARESGEHDRDGCGVSISGAESHIWPGKVQVPLQLLVEAIPFCALDVEVTL